MKHITCDFCGCEVEPNLNVPVKVGKQDFDACKDCAEAMPFPVKHNAHMIYKETQYASWSNNQPYYWFKCSTCGGTVSVWNNQFPERCDCCDARVTSWDEIPTENHTEEEEN